MAIQPTYARAILDGTKVVEFRKRPLAVDVSTVLIYESSPTQAIVGSFTVGRCIDSTPMKLWRDYGKVGGISKANFKQYYKGSTNAFALTIDDRRRFDRPIALQALTPAPAIPQSFSYVGDDVLRQVLELQDLATLN